MGRRFFVGVGMIVALIAGLATAATADDEKFVTVSLLQVSPERTMFVEDVAGNALTNINFGFGRTSPFRIRVVDNEVFPSDFDVNIAMSKLYRATGASSYDWTTNVPSGDLSISYPTTALSILDPGALLEPVFEVTVTAAEACTALGLVVCPLTSDLVMTVKNAAQSVSLDSLPLNSLPIVPQAGESDNFPNPHYRGIAAGDTGKPGTWSATQLRVLSGAANDDLSAVSDLLESLGVTVDPSAMQAAIDSSLTTALSGAGVTPPVSVSDAAELLVDQATSVLNTLGINNILGVNGTYISFPILNASVPAGTPGGEYRGTMVVTLVSS